MQYGITSVEQIIDIDGIKVAVEKIKSTAEDLTSCANAVEEASDLCNKEALAIDNMTMQPTIDEIAEYIKAQKSQVDAAADQILEAANQIYITQCNELNTYLEELQKSQNGGQNYV